MLHEVIEGGIDKSSAEFMLSLMEGKKDKHGAVVTLIFYGEQEALTINNRTAYGDPETIIYGSVGYVARTSCGHVRRIVCGYLASRSHSEYDKQ